MQALRSFVTLRMTERARDCHEPNGSRNDEDSVILNEVKNLEVSVAVDGSTNLEILRFTQDDIV